MNLRIHGFAVLVLGLAWALFCSIVIGDLSGPMEGSPDLAGWDYSGYYLRQHLTFSPWPSLQFNSDDLLYPFGTSAVFQSWGLERDYFYLLMQNLYGRGPWLQLYYMVSTLLVALFTYGVLAAYSRQNHERWRALVVALLCAFWNIYALHKYPHHYGIAVVHWSVISLVIDFVIYRQLVCERRVSTALLLLRLFVLVSCLGQELAYIAGIGLCSFTLTVAFSLGLYIYRSTPNDRGMLRLFRKIITHVRADFRHYRLRCGALLLLCLTAIYAYVPLILQIVLETRRYQGSVLDAGTWFANPLRLFLPYFPFFQPNHLRRYHIPMFDLPEGFGAASPGWAVLFLGVCGLYYGRHHLRILAPSLVLFILVWFYHPTLWPTLKLFPWYRFARVGARMTFVMTPILLLAFMAMPWGRLGAKRRWTLIGISLLFLGLESQVVFYYHQHRQRDLTPSNTFFSYMDRVKKQPGSAVFDWPMCIIGGNYTANCPYRDLSTVYAWQKYHHKKVVSAYFGRLHPDMVRGWHSTEIFAISNVQRQRCLQEKEVASLARFMAGHDFAGMSLYLRYVGPACRPLFYKYFGQPVAEMMIPIIGKVVFLTANRLKTPEG